MALEVNGEQILCLVCNKPCYISIYKNDKVCCQRHLETIREHQSQ